MKRIEIHKGDDVNIDRAYENLANAIVMQAVYDYRRVLRGKRLEYDNNKKVTIEELEKFFHSGWFYLLTNVDGQTIINRLRREYKNENQIGKRNGNIHYESR